MLKNPYLCMMFMLNICTLPMSRPPLAEAERVILEKLLTYGPTIAEHTPTGLLVLVTPRPGTISPWSSKATNIAHNCGLKQINRLERGIAYYVTADALTAEQQKNYRCAVA